MQLFSLSKLSLLCIVVAPLTAGAMDVRDTAPMTHEQVSTGTAAKTDIPIVTITLPAPGEVKKLGDGSTVDATGTIRDAAGQLKAQIRDDGTMIDVSGKLLSGADQVKIVNLFGNVDHSVKDAATGLADSATNALKQSATSVGKDAVTGAAASLGIPVLGANKSDTADAGLVENEKPIARDKVNLDLSSQLKGLSAEQGSMRASATLAASTPVAKSDTGSGIVECGKYNKATSFTGGGCGQSASGKQSLD